MTVRCFAILLLGSFGAVAGAAQTVQAAGGANAAQQAKPEDRCVIEGTIVSLKTGQPLGKADIQLRHAEGNSQTTYGAESDASGHYVVENIDPGAYMLSVSRNGYVRTSYGPGGKKHAATAITLTRAQHMTKVDVKLPPQGVVTGRVVDEDNEPMANVSVQLMSRGYQNGKRTMSPSESGATNDKGEYRIFGVGQGKYWALAHVGRGLMIQPTEVRTTKKDQLAYPATYYPSSLSPGEAVQIQVTSGAELDGIDFHLVKIKSFTVSGKVANAGSVRGTSVQLLPQDSDGGTSWDRMKIAIADGEGGYSFPGIQPGRYELTANSFSAESRSSAHAEVVVSDSDVSVPLTFGENPDVHGTVRTDDPSDVIKPGILVGLQPDMGMGGSTPGETKEDGSFTLKSVALQRLRLFLYPMPEGHYIKSVQLGNAAFDDTMLDLTSGVAGELTVTLSAKGATLSGVVQDDQQRPVTSGTVVLVPDDAKLQSRYGTASPDQNGQFTIKNIHPGLYKAFAFDDVESGIWMDPDWLKAYEKKGESVEVKESDKATKNLVVIATDEQ